MNSSPHIALNELPGSGPITPGSDSSTESKAKFTGLASSTETSARYSYTERASLTSQQASDDVFSQGECPSGEEEDLQSTSSDRAEGKVGLEKTVAERLAQSRRMKRFRLTHAQTRYLMSEFTREAHPAAGQRERMSRDIPGLSPRQVQVWFQNRRAKLKRLTADDQDRMMRSRALPEGFDFAQALHSTLAEQHFSLGSTATLSAQNLTDDDKGPVLAPQPLLSPTSTLSTLSNVPHCGGSAPKSVGHPPISPINDPSYPAASPYFGTRSPIARHRFIDTSGYSGTNFVGSTSQEQRGTELAGRWNPSRSEPLTSTMALCVTTSSDAYGHGWNPIQYSPALVENQDVSRQELPLTLPVNIYDQDPVHHSPAAGLAGHLYSSVFLSRPIDVTTSQIYVERLAQQGQSLLPAYSMVHPQPPTYPTTFLESQ